MRLFIFVCLLFPGLLLAQKQSYISFYFTKSIYDAISFLPASYRTCDAETKPPSQVSNKSSLHIADITTPFVLKMSYGKHFKNIFIEPGDSIDVQLVNDSLDELAISGIGAEKCKFLITFNKMFFSSTADASASDQNMDLTADALQRRLLAAKHHQEQYYYQQNTTRFSAAFNAFMQYSIAYNYYSRLLAGYTQMAYQQNETKFIDTAIINFLDHAGSSFFPEDALENEHYRSFVNNYIGYKAATLPSVNISFETVKYHCANDILKGNTLVWYLADLLNCNYKQMRPALVKMILDKLDSIDTDSNYIPGIRSKFEKYTVESNAVEKPVYANTLESVELETLKGEVFKMEQLKGKVVYVDFWASWCGPCRRQFPDAQALHQRFTKKQLKNIVFLYISIDTDKEAWKKASTAIDSNSAIVLLKKGVNTFFETDIDIKSIPRYMLINKEGKIVDYNAPKPSSIEESYKKIFELL